MKKSLFSLILLLVSYVGFSQKGLSYQAVILDPAKIEIPGQDISSQPLVNGDVWLKFSIYNGSTLQFEEVHKTKTDNYGLVNLLIGSVSSASFNSLVWDSSQKSLQVFVSFNQGGSYTKISDQKLNYNPYALFAETAGKLGVTLPISGGGTGATTAADARANLGLDQVNNTSDAAKPVSTATQTALNLKANSADVTAALALKANTADVTSALDLKANAADMTAALAAKADTGTIKTFVVTQVAASIADADAYSKGKIQLAGDLGGTADAPTVPGLAAKADAADVIAALALKANSVDMTNALALKANGSTVATSLNLKENTANKSLNVNSDGSSDIKYPSVKAVKDYVDARVQSGVSSASIADADANTKGKIQLAGDLGGTATVPTVPGLALKANAADVTTLTTRVNANTASITANSTAINSKAPLASPTFSGTVSAPIYASTPQILTAGATINWNPANGLNASVTLNQNSTLSFTNTPAVGSYGTLVLTQDATGGRTITLPSTSNKVLGSTSSTTIDLSTAANAIDIVNFYYDGTNYFWNIGQGYGTAASSSSTNLASGVTGTLSVANGGTGATTLTGLIKGNGTSAMSSAVAGTDYLAPNGSAANLTNFPTLNQNTTGNAATATLATTATNATTAGNITATSNTTLTSLANLTTVGTITSGTWSGTAIAVANGGTGATTAAAARTNLGLVIGTNVQAPLVAGTDYLAPNGSAASLTNFPTLNQNTTGNAATATLATTATTATNATTAGNITATSNTTLTSLANLTTVGTITSGIWSGTAIAVANGGTGATTAADARTNLGLVIGTNVQAPITLTTTGTGAATFSGTTLNIPTPSSGSSNTHYVGESYGGGVVFYTYDNGAHGLIVSLTDQCCNSSTIGRFSAGTATNTLAYNGSGGALVNNQTAYTTVTGGGVGAGKKNTLLIIASQGLGNGNKYAARYANEYSILSDGVLYDDWYLGSVDEYHLLANNYPQVLANNSFTPLNGPNKDYWTSTEINLTDAFTVYIRTNSTTSNIFNVFPNAKSMFNNGGYGNVRAIRSF